MFVIVNCQIICGLRAVFEIFGSSRTLEPFSCKVTYGTMAASTFSAPSTSGEPSSSSAPTQDQEVKAMKCVLVGDKGTGKTTFINRFLNTKQTPLVTFAPYVYPLLFDTNKGELELEVWDVVGQKKFEKFRYSHYYKRGQCSIIVFDVTCTESFSSVFKWRRDLQLVCGNIPMVLCGNKVDRKDRIINAKTAMCHRKSNFEYFDISAICNLNLEQPFLWLAQKLLHEPELEFNSLPALVPPEVQIEPVRLASIETDLKEARSATKLDEDDD